jgi:triosephosphate isomerase
MPKLIAANFKMNGSFSFIEEWFDAFNKEDTSSNEVIVALPAPYLGMSGNDCRQ